MNTILSHYQSLLLLTFISLLFSVTWSVYNSNRLKYFFLAIAARYRAIKWWKGTFAFIKLMLFAIIAYSFYGFTWYALLVLCYMLFIIWLLGDILLNALRGLNIAHRGSNFFDRFNIWIKIVLVIISSLLVWLLNV